MPIVLLLLAASACAFVVGTVALVYFGELLFASEVWLSRRALERDVFDIQPRPAVIGVVGLILWPIPRILRACGWRPKTERAVADAFARLATNDVDSTTGGRRETRVANRKPM